MPKQLGTVIQHLPRPSVSDQSWYFLDPCFHFHRESTLIKSRLRVSVLKQKPCCLLGRPLSCGLCFSPAWEIPCIFDPSKSAAHHWLNSAAVRFVFPTLSQFKHAMERIHKTLMWFLTSAPGNPGSPAEPGFPVSPSGPFGYIQQCVRYNIIPEYSIL